MNVVEIVPHGLCNGVNAAVSRALALRDAYFLHAPVHNEIVLEDLRALGHRIVESVDEVPEGATVVFSAHGVSPRVREAVKARGLKVVDLTCPFVARAHAVARAAAERGDEVAVLGDRRHVEVKGILGELEGLPSCKDRTRPLTVVCQTTMTVREAEKELERLRAGGRDIREVRLPCGATQERQQAVADFCRRHPGAAVLVLGSETSANSRRLCAVAEEGGAKAFLAGSLDEVRAFRAVLEEFGAVGVTSGASTPERFYMETVKILKNVPTHVAIIMDGNGRWAQQRGKERGAGHAAGAKKLDQVTRWCGARGIRYLTVYAFSTENWRRSEKEVSGLMRLFATMMKTHAATFMRDKVRFRVIGRRGDLSPVLQKAIAALEKKTEKFERELILCVSYGGRAEIADAVNRAVAKGERVTEETFRQYLYAPDVPDPDLIIRTSGECRTSNFLCGNRRMRNITSRRPSGRTSRRRTSTARSRIMRRVTEGEVPRSEKRRGAAPADRRDGLRQRRSPRFVAGRGRAGPGAR